MFGLNRLHFVFYNKEGLRGGRAPSASLMVKTAITKNKERSDDNAPYENGVGGTIRKKECPPRPLMSSIDSGPYAYIYVPREIYEI